MATITDPETPPELVAEIKRSPTRYYIEPHLRPEILEDLDERGREPILERVRKVGLQLEAHDQAESADARNATTCWVPE